MFHHLSVIIKQLKLRARSRLTLVEKHLDLGMVGNLDIVSSLGGVEGAVFKVFLALEGPTILACSVVCKRSSYAREFGLRNNRMARSALTRDTIGF